MICVRIALVLAACLAACSASARCRVGALDSMAERPLVHGPVGDSSAPMPLVVLLHGSTGTGAAMLRDSGLAATADRHGFVVVAPDGGIAATRGYVWNIPGVPTVDGALPAKDARDDVAYLVGLVDRLAATGCVDDRRVYLTGLSGGGRMVSWLGCVAPGRFAAMAPVVGLRAGRPLASDRTRVDRATCRAGKPLPLMAFSGDADTTNPIAGGGAPYWQYSQSTALQRWAELNRCSRPYARTIGPAIYEQGYALCPGDATVAVRVTRGGGHGWSVVDNEAMWAFLSRHRR